jgi:hypothetical protein
MVSFLRYAAIYIALLGLFAAPVLAVARHYRQATTFRRFLIAAVAVGVVCGAMAAVSQRLEQQCQEAGNTSCQDYGGDGLVNLLLVGFLATSLGRAYLIHNE